MVGTIPPFILFSISMLPLHEVYWNVKKCYICIIYVRMHMSSGFKIDLSCIFVENCVGRAAFFFLVPVVFITLLLVARLKKKIL